MKTLRSKIYWFYQDYGVWVNFMVLCLIPMILCGD